MPKNTRNRNDRNNPYLIEGWAVDFHRSKAGIAWRWRTELAILTVTVAGYVRLAAAITALWAGITLAALITAALVVPHSRRFLKRRAWCLITRHRLQRVCYETRMHTRAGRLPLILWIRPTRVGERAFLLCRAGICIEDFEACTAEIASACYAREARVIRNRKWSQLVTVDVVRHDPLTPQVIIPAQVIPPNARTRQPAA
jgi:hypothetical protein